VGNEHSIIGKQEVTDPLLKSCGVGQQPPKIQQIAIKARVDEPVSSSSRSSMAYLSIMLKKMLSNVGARCNPFLHH